MSNEPKDPFGTFADGAVIAHEVYMSYVKAGFTRAEALKIIIAIITNIQTDLPQPPVGGDANG